MVTGKTRFGTMFWNMSADCCDDFSIGDHLLTAINVARDCDMLPVGERVILVSATAPVGNSLFSVKYSLAEMYEADRRSTGEQSVLSTSSDTIPWLTESWPESIFQPLENMTRLWRRQVHVDIEHSQPPRIHFAVCGKTLDVIRKHCPDLLPRILCRSTILARMAPDQKTKVFLITI